MNFPALLVTTAGPTLAMELRACGFPETTERVPTAHAPRRSLPGAVRVVVRGQPVGAVAETGPLLTAASGGSR